MRIIKRLLVIAVVLVTCVGCDQTTKSVAQSILPETETWSFLGDTVRLQLAYNQGGFLGLGASLPAVWRAALFSVGASAMLLGLLGYALFAKTASRPVILAFALLFAGGVGNLIDRLLYAGTVIDFINIGIGPVRTGIFNVADIAVTAGILLLGAAALHNKDAASSKTRNGTPGGT